MSNRLEKLLFRVAMIDKVSGPAGKIAKSIDDITNRTTAGFAKVGVGAAGMWATGRALESMLGPSIAMDRAIGEVKSLGVADDALKKLERTALRFSMRYGESATDFVSASYDIQSAIAGLTGSELSKFTNAGGVLAKATKSDTATITDYMGTMYGIFQNTANEMGKAEWVEMLAGQTASAVQMFKTTGSEMAASFANLGAEAQSHGVGIAEQMAILGTLQATMSGSEAGTKYKSFLAGVGKAQDELGLKFTDSQGRLLPMVDILQKIQGKFGDIDTVAESDALKKAFGTKEAVGLIKLLSQNIDGLTGNISTLADVGGMDKAIEMADAMVDPWERLQATGTAIKTVFGRVLQPVLVPLLNSLTEGGDTIVRWTDMFPNLTRAVGVGVLTVFGLVAAVSAFTLVGGIAQMVAAGWGGIMLLSTGILKLWRLAVIAAQGTWLLLNLAIWGGGLALNALRTALLGSTAATWLMNAALLANPITWIVLAVVALAGAVAAAIYYWEDLTKWFSEVSAIELLGDSIDWLIDKINLIPGINIGGDDAKLPKVKSPTPDPVNKAGGNLAPVSGPDSPVAPISAPVVPELASLPLPKQITQPVGLTAANDLPTPTVVAPVPTQQVVEQVVTPVSALPAVVQPVERQASRLPEVMPEVAKLDFEAPALTQAVAQTLVDPVELVAPKITQVIEREWQEAAPELPQPVQGVIQTLVPMLGTLKTPNAVQQPVEPVAASPLQLLPQVLGLSNEAPNAEQGIFQHIAQAVPSLLPDAQQGVVQKVTGSQSTDPQSGVLGLVPQILGSLPVVNQQLPAANQAVTQTLANPVGQIAADAIQNVIPILGDAPQGTASISPVMEALPKLQSLTVGVAPVLGSLAGLGKIPARNDGDLVEKAEKEKAAMAMAVPTLNPANASSVPSGGLLQQITNATTNNNKANHIEKLEVHTTQKVDAWLLEDELSMA